MNKIKVNSELCIGCFLCVQEFPHIFQANEYGTAEVKPGEELNAQAEPAINNCPMVAIEEE
jgi:ferredoxin